MVEIANKKLYEYHSFYVFIIIVIITSFFIFEGYFNPDYMPPIGNDLNDQHEGNYIVLKDSILKYGSFFPFWNPYILSGTNYIAKLTPPDLLYLFDWLILFINPIELATKIIIVICFLISALGMYILANYLIKDKTSAFISSLFYVFNGFSITLLIKGWSEYVRSFCLIPFIILFIILSFNSKRWFLYSSLTSILLALQVFAGGSITFLWTLVLIGFLFIFKIVECLFLKKNIIKIILIFLMIFIFAAGLSAVRTIPAKEYLKYSDRANGVPYEQSLWQKITFDCKGDPNYCVWGLIEPSSFPKPPLSGFGYKIGVMGLILFLLGIYSKFKNKYVLFFGLAAIISVLISLGTPLYYIIYKYAPGFSTHRYPHRALIIFAFSISLIIGYGFSYLSEKLRQKYNLNGIKLGLTYSFLVVIILLDLLFLGYHLPNQLNIRTEIENNEIYNYIAAQNGTFRTHVQDIYSTTRGLNHLLIPLNIQFTYGYEQTFNTEYMPIFLSVANSDPAKFFGILNVKYITSSKILNISGYDFIKRFNYSKYTQSEELNQTYLYKNSLFLPRYSIIPNAILVVGEDNSVKQAVYWLMLNKNFDPKKGIIVKGKNKISDYSLEELNKFNAIVLTKDSIDQNSINILNRYVENGKIILPDITKNKQSIEDAEIESLFQSLKGNFEEIKTEYYSPDKIIFNIKNQRGFIFISEQYSIYPGWDVFIDNKESNILRADGVFSSVYIDDKNKNIVFEYNSKSFFYGSMISIISLMIILFYISYLLVNIHKNKKIHENERKL